MDGGVVLTLIWFVLLYGIVYISDKNVDIFSPLKFVTLIYIIRNIPYIALVCLDESIFPANILQVVNKDIGDAFLQYTFVQTIAFVSLLVGIKFNSSKKYRFQRFHAQTSDRQFKRHFWFVIITAGIGIMAYLQFIHSLGGIFFLLSNLSERVSMQKGQYILILIIFLSIATVLSLKLIQIRPFRKYKVLFALLFTITIFVNSSLGGRKTTLYLVATCVVAYHYIFKPLSFKNIKKRYVLIVSVLLSVYIFLIPLLRAQGGYDSIKSGKVDVIEVFDFKAVLSYMSYTNIDVFTANYFNMSNVWSFKTLLTIPTHLMTSNPNDKPPIDEGIYYYNIVQTGRYCSPPEPRKGLMLSGLPIENLGFGYANFLYMGVVIAFFFQGVIFSYVYKLMQKHKYSPIMIYLYVFIIFNFNFSSLRLLNLITLLPLLCISYFTLDYNRKK
ncbi:MAG: oligosaccharide repeat unit polymerase [Bacteroidales bacterium]|jgi:hypothetical protein|nr:oligosaccharide repeat unit polymerase [Bacteroidales bacterium]